MPAVLDAVHDGKERSRKKAQAIIAFASDLQKRLPTEKGDHKTAAALRAEVQKQVSVLERYADKANHGMHGDDDMEREGTNLWNLCTRLNREITDKTSKGSESSRLVLASRVLSYEILHLCQWSSKSQARIACHLMRIALKAAKVCTDNHDVQTARSVLQRAADYNGRLQELSQTLGQDEADECSQLEAEWTAMRIALAWQDNQLEVAEHTFMKIEDSLKNTKPKSVEKIVDSIFHVGKGLLSKQDFAMAEKWLQRAWDTINSQQLQDMSRDAIELRMAILQAMITVLMGHQTADSIERAHNLVKYVESEVGDQPIILLLNLEMLSKSPAEAFDSEAYGNIIRRMVRSFRPTEANFKLLAHHIHVLHTKCPGFGNSVLDDFLALLVPSGQAKWIDKIVVKRIWMATSYRDFEGTVDGALKAMSVLEHSVSAEASFAAQALMWKKIESNFSQAQYQMAEKWCQLALDRAFDNSGPSNRAKLERKLLLCSLSRNDLDAAKSAFFSMAPATQLDPMTQYLMYRTTIRSGDAEMAAECLENVARSSIRFELLYACVADSQNVGDRFVTLQAMKRLAAVYDYKKPGKVNFPALCRCTIMLQHGLLNSSDKMDQETVVTDLCDMFDGVAAAVQQAPKDAEGNRLFDIKELEWFCQNAYNLGLKHAGDWHLQNVVRILTACISLMDNFPEDIAAEMASDLSFRSIFCNFLISSALVALARAEDNREQQLQDYLVLRKHVAAADTKIQHHLQGENVDEVLSRDLCQKLAHMLAFDFEGAVALKRYDDLKEIVLKAEQCQHLDTFKAMADCALRSQLPSEVLFNILRTIINQIVELDEFDPTRLAKYARCLFQATLPLNKELAGMLLDETCRMVKDAHDTPAAWPAEDVNWFASTAYNHAIDMCGRDDMTECKHWAQKAMNLAHYCRDGGHLEGLMQDYYVKYNLNAVC